MTAVRSLVAGLLTVPVLALAAPAADAAPAAAPCTVKLGSKPSVVAAAAKVDAVFAAKVVDVTSNPASLGKPLWMLDTRVLTGFQGPARKGGHASIMVGEAQPRGAKAPAKGATYLFFADQRSGGFTADVCGGLVRLRKGLTNALATRLKTDLAGSTGGQTVTLSEPSGGVRDLPALSRIAAPGAGVALFGVLGLLFVRRLGRERH